MPRKPKFKPVIARVKLNPEQAVLVCDCYTAGPGPSGGNKWYEGTMYRADPKIMWSACTTSKTVATDYVCEIPNYEYPPYSELPIAKQVEGSAASS